MAKKKSEKQVAIPGDSGWLTLKEAAELCGTTQAELRSLIERGQLRAFTIKQGGNTRFRLLRSSLIDAGVLRAPKPEKETRGAKAKVSVDLLALIRDQNQRISALEDQRAILSGQLGVALERLRSIDERLIELEADQPIDEKHRAELQPLIDSKGTQKIKTSFLKVVAVAPTGKRWKRGKK